MADTQSTTKFKADISQLKSEMQAARRVVRLATSEFKAATAGMDDWGSSADGLQSKIKQLNKVLDAQKRQVALAKQELEKVSQEYGENSAEADRARIKVNNFEAEVGKTEKELKQYEQELDNVGDETKDTVKETEKASEGFTVMKGVLANLVASAIKAAISGLKDLAGAAKEAYEEFDAGEDNVIKATGATGEAAEKLKESYKNVAKSVRGDFDSLGSTLGEVNTRFGFTDAELEDATVRFQKFAEITGTDATQAVQLVSRAMGDAGIESQNYGELLDQLATAAQQSGISVDSLTEMLTKYGAPMRNLGFDTKESIAIFSSWEKAGVNTQIAFSGMRKAISNWSKDGKDAREEFRKTLKDIESTPDRAKATTKAIEVFGAKAGPDLADAILEGRFAYEDFLELLEESPGSVERTYEATEDGFDKIQLAIQGAKADLGSLVGEMLTKYQPQIERFIKTATTKVKGFVTYVVNNKETVAGVLTTLGGLFTTAFTVNKVSNFVRSLQTMSPVFTTIATKIGIFTAAEAAAEGTTLALNTAMLANPALWLVAGIGALAAVMLKFRSSEEKAIEKTYGLSDAEKDLMDSIDSRYQAQKEANEARDETVDGIASESNYTRKLVDAYNDLIDSNGKVKKGEKNRADFIINELCNALGLEKDKVKELIDENGKLSDSIDDLIIKKQAEATLNAYEDSYYQAINNKKQATDDMVDAQLAYNKTKEKASELEEQYKQAYNDWVKAAAAGQATMQEQPADLRKIQDELTTTNDKLAQQKDNLDKANQAYQDSQTTIQNYRGLSQAIISEDTDEINKQLNNLTNGFKTATSATRQELTQQVKDYQEHYDNIKEAMESGNTNITQEMVDEAKELVNAAKKELSYLPAETAEIAKNVPTSIADSIANGDIKTPIDQLQSSVDFSELSQKAEQAGFAVPEQLKAGIASGDVSPADAVSQLIFSMNGELEKAAKESGKPGADYTIGYVNGVLSVRDNVTKAVTTIGDTSINTLKNKLQEHSPSKATQTAGSDFTLGFANGIEAGEEGVKTIVGNLAQSVLERFGIIPKEAKKQGASTGSQYAQGVSSKSGSAKKAGESVAKSGVTGAKSGGKNAKKTGQTAGRDYIKGIESVKAKIKKSSETAGKDTITGIEKGGKNSKKTGQKTGEDYVKGVDSKKGAAKSAGQAVGSSGKSGMSQGQGAAGESYGKALGEGYVRGIRSKIPAARAAAADLANASKSVIPKTNKSHSPSRVTLKYGKDFTQGYINGIASLQGKVVSTTKNMVKAVVTEMAKMSNYNFAEVGSNASSIFSDALEKKISYTMANITYKNEQKLKEFDSEISALTAGQKAKEKLQSEIDKAKSRIKTINKKKNQTAADKKELKELKANITKWQNKIKKQYSKNYKQLIQDQNVYKASYQEASAKMLSEYQDALNEYQMKAQALIDSTINGITDKYTQRYDELIGKQDSLISKLKEAGDLFEVSGAGVMTVNDLKAQTKAITDYTSKLQKIKAKVSSELFDQIVSYDMDQGSAFLDRILAMSANDLNAYNKAYTEKMQAAQKAGENIYSADLKKVSSDYQKELNAAFAKIPGQLAQLGKEAMKGFVNGLTQNTDYMNKNIKTFVKAMVANFKKQLKIKSPSRVMMEIGEYTFEGFADPLRDGIKTVRGIIKDMASEVSAPLFDAGINAGTVRQVAAAGLPGRSVTSSNVVNNYNLVQNNSSPRPLTALETYRARRRQINMVKALTQGV